MNSDTLKTITILSASYRSGPHLNRLFNNLKIKADNHHCLQFIVVDNTNGQDIDLKDAFSKDLEIQFVMNDGSGLQRSISHSSALDCGIQNCETEFTLIIDPDVHVFKAGWDNFCIGQMNKVDKLVIGAPYPEWKLGKVHDFPSVVFMFFRTRQVVKFDKSFYPFPRLSKRILNSIFRKVTRLGILTSKSKLDKSKKLRKITKWLEKITGITSPDTGKQIIEAFRREGFKALNFKASYSSDIANNVKNAEIELSKQFESYYLNDEIIMTHMYGSGVFHWRSERGADLDHWQDLISEIDKGL